jgi:hypothetical protein
MISAGRDRFVLLFRIISAIPPLMGKWFPTTILFLLVAAIAGLMWLEWPLLKQRQGRRAGTITEGINVEVKLLECNFKHLGKKDWRAACANEVLAAAKRPNQSLSSR